MIQHFCLRIPHMVTRILVKNSPDGLKHSKLGLGGTFEDRSKTIVIEDKEIVMK